MSLTRRLILQKARHHPTHKARALTDCRQTVSGTISLPSRGTFHHSLTVLIRYRSPGSIQPYQVVLANSPQITGVRGYSRNLQGRTQIFGYRTLTLYGPAFTPVHLTNSFITPGHSVSCAKQALTTPVAQPLTGITRHRFRLNPLSLATTHGITIVFSSCRY